MPFPTRSSNGQCPHRGARLSLGRVTPEGQLAQLNLTAATLLGRARSELLGRRLAMLVAESDLDLIHCTDSVTEAVDIIVESAR